MPLHIEDREASAQTVLKSEFEAPASGHRRSVAAAGGRIAASARLVAGAHLPVHALCLPPVA